MTTQHKTCANCKTEFIIEPDDFTFYAKIQVPPPTLCPTCRRQRRLSFRNDHDFYKRACDLCKKSIIALYPADAKFPVYCMKCWWSDSWDPYQYGRDYDPSRSFLEQCDDVFKSVPTIAMQNDDSVGSVNCEYTTDWWFSKNCYMTMTGWHDENVYYSYGVEHSKDVMDSSHIKNCERIYECFGSTKCSRCAYCTFCHDSVDCYLSYDLHGCSDCVMCVGLRNKKYCILNEQYTKEEYLLKLKAMNLQSREALQEHRKTFQKFVMKFPRRYAQILKSVNTTGDMLMNCKNSQECYFGNGLENCKFIVLNDSAKETYDCNATGHPELCYEGITPDYSYHAIATIFCVRCREVAYSSNCAGAEHLMGCAGIKKGGYVILNKQYEPQEYEKLKQQIIADMKARGEWGEFFPKHMSPFAYNESIAYDFDQITKTQALANGFRWKEESKREVKPTLLPHQIPDSIDGMGDDILQQIIQCSHVDTNGRPTCVDKCTSVFRVTPNELQFYRSMGVPVPRLCSNCRHFQRIQKRNPVVLHHRQCMCKLTTHQHEIQCLNEFETTYSPDRPEIVYCEQCYQQEIN